jgi:signal transduction histidine kinase
MRICLPRATCRTLRFRLTALYGGLFLTTSAVLLAVSYVLTYGSTSIAIVTGDGKVLANAAGPGARQTLHARGKPTAAELRLAHQAMSQIAQRQHDLHQLLIGSGIALAIMTGLAVATGWLIAGRVLRPMRMMKTATQQITERSLHERLALPGPRDEVKDLADTIDALLARLQAAFEAQRRFVASASHELRTPLTLNRALLEVALADPAASAADLRVTCEELITAGEQQERLVEALLTLATAEHGLDRADEFDLADIARRALGPQRAQAAGRGLRLDASLGRAVVRGDPDLAERMAANLIDNAIRYNIPGGSVRVRTETEFDHAVLTVSNTGPTVPPDKAGQLFEPFQRLIDDRASHPDGHGLGLSVVRAIADAHNASLETCPQPHGGLIVRAGFPSSSGPRAAYEALPVSRSAAGLSLGWSGSGCVVRPGSSSPPSIATASGQVSPRPGERAYRFLPNARARKSRVAANERASDCSW